ncbi:MAG: class I SAM-dependent methyltransferase [Anaerolineales bacterium]|nr:class I SAM-dependent methyltransferase [Anaerolineales bacterium]
MSTNQTYIPALSIDALTRYYDPALATIFQEQRFRMPLVNRNAQTGDRVLDIGCGTATLMLLVGEHTAAKCVVGLDIDPAMLATAAQKTAQRNDLLLLTRGSAACLPYADGSFDHVVSSLMLHHLETMQKQGMLAEAWRVLKPGGSILVMDFGPVGSGMVTEGTAAVFGRFERIDDNLRGRVPEFLRVAGFVDVFMEDVALAGVVKMYSGRKG